jgi:hypothetical protein
VTQGALANQKKEQEGFLLFCHTDLFYYGSKETQGFLERYPTVIGTHISEQDCDGFKCRHSAAVGACSNVAREQCCERQ